MTIRVARPEVRRVDTTDLPYASLRCLAYGHRWSDPPARDAGRGRVEVVAECDCGRWRRDVIEMATGDVADREYGGGVMVWAGMQPTRQEARVMLIRARRTLVAS